MRTAAQINEALLTAAVRRAHKAGADEYDLLKTWVTQADDRVRHEHAVMHGRTVPYHENFRVAGFEMFMPGDLSAPDELICGCRCILRIRRRSVLRGAGEREDIPMDDGDLLDSVRVPWHGVLAPEGTLSGDKRKFAEGSLRHRDFPLPLKYQEADAEGHDGSVRVANIQDLRRYDGKIVGWGWMDTSDNADEAARQLAEGMLRGVSVDVDDAEFAFEDADGNPVEGDAMFSSDPIMVITDGRISGATLCSIPAFQEAFVSLGEPPTEWGFDMAELVAAGLTFESVSDKPWSDFTQADYTDEQWKRACVLDKGESAGEGKQRYGLPIREPSGMLNRNGVHSAAGRFNQVSASAEAKASAKAALRRAYGTLGEEPPDVIAASGEMFVDDSGIPGHLPQKLRRYWTHGEGAAKIGWGTGGDFNRCRAALAQYVPTRMLSGLCANLHHDATGKWPGPGGPPSRHASVRDLVVAAPSLCPCAITASAAVADDFANPHFDRLTPLTIDGDRVFGHLAGWGTCHIGFADQCVTPPSSAAGYAYFHTGEVLTADNQRLPVGHITMNTGHAALGLKAQPAAAHYDDTGWAVADVVGGEDEYGIWLTGRLRPGVTEEQKAALAAAALSGDWRRVGGSMELVAALAVNVPGFPIPRTSSAMVAGAQTAIVATGIVTAKQPSPQPLDLSVIAREIRAMDRRRQRADAVAASIGRDRASRRASAMALRGED